MNDKTAVEKHIIDYIPTGKTNAIHLKTLAAELEKPVHIVKRMIQQARKDNIILSASCGYWIPESKEELESWLHMMKGQAISRLQTIKHTRQELKRDPDQITLENIGRESGVK